MFIDYIIRRAKRTPYFHLDSYMMRWWLVPYGRVVERRVPDAKLTEQLGIPSFRVYTDGTGPVTWRRPIAKMLQLCGISARVHEILSSDTGRDPHDHPFNFLTIILRGGYHESRYNDAGQFIGVKYHGPGSILYRPAGSWHRLDLPNGMVTTTLFITGPKKQSWGFNVKGKKVPYWEYLAEKKGDV